MVVEQGKRTDFRVWLNWNTVCALRERAAREAKETGGRVTWADLLRRAADRAAAEGGAK